MNGIALRTLFLKDLVGDVSLASPIPGDTLVLGPGGLWENGPAPAAPISLDDLLDVETATPAPGHLLTYVDLVGWTNRPPAAPVIGLDALTDVTMAGPQPGQVLTYTGSGQWTNLPLPAAPTYALGDLTDVKIAGVKDQQHLLYSAQQGRWINADPDANINISNPVQGQVLMYSNGNVWRNEPLPTPPAPVLDLDDLTDVAVANVTPGQVLTALAGGQWTNAALPTLTYSLDDLTDAAIANPAANEVLTFVAGLWVNRALPSTTIPPLSTLPDVTISAPTTGQILTYDASATRWKNLPPATLALDAITDVNAPSPTDGQALLFESASNQWKNKPVPPGALSGLTDVHLTTLTNNQVLTYQTGTGWVNAGIPALSVDLNALTDVIVNNPLSGQTLIYDGAGQWRNQPSPTGVTTLAALTDVALAALVDAQVLTYVAGSGKWANRALPAQNQINLDGLTDVTIAIPSNGQVLTYEVASSQWKNAALPAPPTVNLDALTDVSVSAPGNNQVLTYEVASAQWKNKDVTAITSLPLDGLTDVTLANPANGQVLTYEFASGQWKNLALPALPTYSLDSLTDVTIASPTDGQRLVYDGATSQWKNVAATDLTPYVLQAGRSNAQQIAGGTASGGNLTLLGANVADFGTITHRAATHIWQSDATTERMRLTGTGRLGIGTATPAALLDIVGTDAFGGITVANFSATSNPYLSLARRRGSVGAISETQSGDITGEVRSFGWSASGGGSYGTGSIKFLQSGASGAAGIPADIAFSTGSATGFAETMRLTSAGFLGIGTASPGSALHIRHATDFNINLLGIADVGQPVIAQIRARGTSALPTIVANGDILGIWRAMGYDGATNLPGAEIRMYVSAAPAANSLSGDIRFLTNSAGTSVVERMRISAGGNVGIGPGGATPPNLFTIQSTGNAYMQAIGLSNTATPALLLSRARAGTTLVQLDDVLGQVNFQGYDSAAYQNAAVIQAVAQGAPAAGNMPADLRFLTTGSGTVGTERMRIRSSGQVGIGAGAITYTHTLHVTETANSGIGLETYQATPIPRSYWSAARGTPGAPQAVAATDYLGWLNFRGSDGTAFRSGATISVRVASAPTATGTPSYMSFTVNDGTNEFEAMRLLSSRHIRSIAIAAPAAADLQNSSWTMWLDPTPASTKLMASCKDSAGTVKTLTIGTFV